MLPHRNEDRRTTACNDNGLSLLSRQGTNAFCRNIVALALATRGSIILTYLADGVFVISRRLMIYRVHVLTHKVR